MTTVNDASYHDRSTESGWKWIRDVVTFGATSSVASESSSDPSLAVTANTTGTFDVAFPSCSEVQFIPGIYSPSLTIDGMVVTALDAAAGTATIKTTAAGVATAPGTGDKLYLTLRLRIQE